MAVQKLPSPEPSPFVFPWRTLGTLLALGTTGRSCSDPAPKAASAHIKAELALPQSNWSCSQPSPGITCLEDGLQDEGLW